MSSSSTSLEFFVMDDLKEVVDERLTKDLTKDNHLGISQAAEQYKVDSLIKKCGYFVYEEMNKCDNTNWMEMEKMLNVMAAFGERALKGKEEHQPLKVLRRREYFASEELYGKFIKENVARGMVVCMRMDYGGGLNEGELVTVKE